MFFSSTMDFFERSNHQNIECDLLKQIQFGFPVLHMTRKHQSHCLAFDTKPSHTLASSQDLTAIRNCWAPCDLFIWFDISFFILVNRLLIETSFWRIVELSNNRWFSVSFIFFSIENYKLQWIYFEMQLNLFSFFKLKYWTFNAPKMLKPTHC